MPRSLPRLSSLVMFAVFVATCIYWILRVSAPAAPATIPVAAPHAQPTRSVTQDAAQLLGGDGTPSAYRVTGIIALGEGRDAAILVDGAGISHTVTAGTQLSAHVTIRQISGQSVVIMRDGVAETLPLSSRTLGASTIIR